MMSGLPWKKCEEEVSRGWSTGACTREDAESTVRVIDDYSVCGQNSTVAPSGKLYLAGIGRDNRYHALQLAWARRWRRARLKL
eukprot:6050268-Amphidinium_carterae.1